MQFLLLFRTFSTLTWMVLTVLFSRRSFPNSRLVRRFSAYFSNISIALFGLRRAFGSGGCGVVLVVMYTVLILPLAFLLSLSHLWKKIRRISRKCIRKRNWVQGSFQVKLFRWRTLHRCIIDDSSSLMIGHHWWYVIIGKLISIRELL